MFRRLSIWATRAEADFALDVSRASDAASCKIYLSHGAYMRTLLLYRRYEFIEVKFVERFQGILHLIKPILSLYQL